MQISDARFEQFLKQQSDLITALNENTKQTTRIAQAQENLATEQQRMNTRLFGEKDDGVIYHLTDRVYKLESKWAMAHAIVLLLSGVFTFLCQKLGWFHAGGH